MRGQDPFRPALPVAGGPGQKALPHARRRTRIRSPRVATRTLHGLYTSEAIAQRRKLKELVRESRKLILKIE